MTQILNLTETVLLCITFLRLMLMEMDRLTILNSYRPQCIGTDLSGMNIFTKHSSILIRTIVGEYCKIYIVTHMSNKKNPNHFVFEQLHNDFFFRITHLFKIFTVCSPAIIVVEFVNES